MAIPVACNNCHVKFSAKESLAGKRVKCPKCNGVLEIPSPQRSSEEDLRPGGIAELLDEWDEERKKAGDNQTTVPSETLTNRCPSCGANMGAEAVLCVACGYHRAKGVQLTTDKNRGAQPEPPPESANRSRGLTHSQQSEPSWEGGGSFGTYIDTIKSVIIDPKHTFTNIVLEGNWQQPASFTICSYLSIFFGALAFLLVFPLVASGAGANVAQGIGYLLGVALIMSLVIILGVVIGLAIRAVATHLCIIVSGPRRGTFETTFRILCYTEGAFVWLTVIPFVGAIYAPISLVYTIVGMKYGHDLPWWRAILVVLMSFVVILAMIILLVIFAAVLRG